MAAKNIDDMRTLKLTRPMMHGPAVKRLQEIGDEMGFDTGPNDGVYGPATQEAVFHIQKFLGLLQDGICGPVTWAAILKYQDEDRGPSQRGNIIDIRGMHEQPKNFGRMRLWSEIDGVTLHQTGCEMPQNLTAWRRVNAHIGISQEGGVVLLNDPTMMIWHAQGLSKRTIGIEIEGNFYGVRGDGATLWKGGGGPHFFNMAMAQACDWAFKWLQSQFAKNGREWTVIHAHRQSSGTRRGDPGSDIWKSVGIPWAERLNLTAADGGDKFCLGYGRPIPKRWDSKRTANY